MVFSILEKIFRFQSAAGCAPIYTGVAILKFALENRIDCRACILKNVIMDDNLPPDNFSESRNMRESNI
jgi:hypothetical protein